MHGKRPVRLQRLKTGYSAIDEIYSLVFTFFLDAN
jgi:hypothetical protein